MHPFDNARYRRPGHCLEGTALFVVGDWGYLLFLAAADRKLSSSLSYFPSVDLYHSSDDSACSCNVESIQDNPRHPLVHLCLANYRFHCLGRYLWGDPLRYVPDSQYSLSNSLFLSRISPVTIVQVLSSRYCNYSSTATPSVTYRAIPRFVLGAALLILAFIPTFKQSVETYKLTKRWQTNRPMKLLVKEGTVYFVVYVSMLIRPFHMFVVHLSHPRLCLKNLTKLTRSTLPPPLLGIYFSTSLI